jgi:hypothetical protein
MCMVHKHSGDGGRLLCPPASTVRLGNGEASGNVIVVRGTMGGSHDELAFVIE